MCSTAYDPEGRIFYTTNNGKHWRDLNVVDLDTGKSRMLIENNRVGDLAFNRADRSLWGVQHHNGHSTVVRIEEPWDSWEHMQELFVLPFGRELFDIDVSHDGQYFTGAMIEIDGSSRLVRMRVEDLMMGDPAFESSRRRHGPRRPGTRPATPAGVGHHA